MRIVEDLRGDTCFFQHFGKAAQTKLVRQAVGAVAQIDNVTVAELQQMLWLPDGRLPDYQCRPS